MLRWKTLDHKTIKRPPQSGRKESMWFYIFSHHERDDIKKMIHFKIYGQEIYLCGRCTFRYLAILITLPIMFYMGYTTHVLYQYPLLLLFFLLLPLPVSMAWLHQFLTKKDNPRPIRYTTGYLLGISDSIAIGCIIWWDLILLIVFISVYISYIGVTAYIVFKKGGFEF